MYCPTLKSSQTYTIGLPAKGSFEGKRFFRIFPSAFLGRGLSDNDRFILTFEWVWKDSQALANLVCIPTVYSQVNDVLHALISTKQTWTNCLYASCSPWWIGSGSSVYGDRDWSARERGGSDLCWRLLFEIKIKSSFHVHLSKFRTMFDVGYWLRWATLYSSLLVKEEVRKYDGPRKPQCRFLGETSTKFPPYTEYKLFLQFHKRDILKKSDVKLKPMWLAIFSFMNFYQRW